MKWLLLDLGGVVVDFVGVREVAALAPEPLSEEQARLRWLESRAVRGFEIGALSPAEFARRFVAEWRLEIAPDEFLSCFEAWNRGLLPGAAELLAELRRSYRVAALSNSNELHWRRNRQVMGLDEHFDDAFSSHELRLLKPDPEIFRAVLGRLGVAAHEVVFLDDNVPNVEGAAAAGISAHLARGVEGVRAALADAGLHG